MDIILCLMMLLNMTLRSNKSNRLRGLTDIFCYFRKKLSSSCLKEKSSTLSREHGTASRLSAIKYTISEG